MREHGENAGRARSYEQMENTATKHKRALFTLLDSWQTFPFCFRCSKVVSTASEDVSLASLGEVAKDLISAPKTVAPQATNAHAEQPTADPDTFRPT